MDSYPSKPEVEKAVPFDERARLCMVELQTYRMWWTHLFGPNQSHIKDTLDRAAALLNEARARGLKGQDPA